VLILPDGYVAWVRDLTDLGLPGNADDLVRATYCGPAARVNASGGRTAARPTLVRLSFERSLGDALCVGWVRLMVIDPIRGERMV
jgi:hypothetical protein